MAAELANVNTSYDLPGVSQTDFGGVGLLQMSTARMARSGEFSASYRDNAEYRRYAVSLQFIDWLETTLRYTDVRTRLYSPYTNFSGDQTYKDKGFDLKARLWKETFWLPESSVGLRDIAGTGLFDSEFFAASKRAGPLDFTLGVGWGNMAESGNIKNPACSISSGFCQRAANKSTGQFEIGNFFHGPAALFGGIEYQTPWNPLRLKLEYDGNDYSNETAGVIKQNTPFNVGFVYRATDLFDTTLSYQRGNTLMWGFTLRTNFNDLKPYHIDAQRQAYALKSVPDINEVNWSKVANELDDNAGYKNANIYADNKQVTVVAEQTKYNDTKEANLRASTILANHLPPTIEEYKIVNTKQNIPASVIKTNADTFKQQQTGFPLGLDQDDSITYKPMSIPTEPDYGNLVLQNKPERWTFSAEPTLTQSIGGAESFYMYQIGAKGSADLTITDHWSIGGTANLNILNNYDRFNYKNPPIDGAALPRVRTWIREYVTSSNVLLSDLQLTDIEYPAKDLYLQTYAGYLELMYAGIGSEILLRPYNQSWAIGVDGNYVRQRDWNDTLQLADYDVFTGHVTTYWDLPFIKGGMAKISVGQYLAGDKGVTFDLSRQFDSGIVAGAFVTKTNVSASDYGEGSFTKGLYISIPLDLMLVHPSTRHATISWVPLTRDGGQKLGTRYSLYNLMKNK
ncbi:YjbH domain-containing protein [uncultured Tolumonas sp.]|uniref:YjbH domain-containing protein n=1 Tax=uncultured Tolumonas sp. TaxID=263765 RepID=UPI0029319424|nr:YjbH domain-containing protein [uncultured Tolumonas sp.]